MLYPSNILKIQTKVNDNQRNKQQEGTFEPFPLSSEWFFVKIFLPSILYNDFYHV